MVSDVDVERGVAFVFAALEAADACYVEAGDDTGPAGYVGYFNEESGVVDMEVSELVKALLAQGWSMPEVDGDPDAELREY